MQQRMTSNKHAILQLLSTVPEKGYNALQIATTLELDLANTTRTLKALVASGALVAQDHPVMVCRTPDATPYERKRPHYSLPS